MHTHGSKVNKLVKNFFKHKDCAGLNVLDLGSGAGANAKFFRKKCTYANVITVDKNPIFNPIFNIDIKDFKFDQKYDIILCLNVLQFLTINEIKKIIPKILDAVEDNGYLMIQMFDSPVADWINQQLGDFKVLDYRRWIQYDKKPHRHTHSMVSWIVKK